MNLSSSPLLASTPIFNLLSSQEKPKADQQLCFIDGRTLRFILLSPQIRNLPWMWNTILLN